MLAPLASPARTKITELGALVVPDYRERLWWYHRAIAEALEGMLRYVRFKGQRGGYARVAISMPPQHGKSLHGTELFPAFALGQDPDLKVIVASNGATLAKKGIANTRQWMDHDGYKSTFPTRFGKVEEYATDDSRPTRVLEVENSSLFFKTIKRKSHRSSEMIEGHGYYLAQGMGGSITGWGYDIGIMDDLVKNAEQALSPSHHKKLWEFYMSTFDTRERGEFSAQLYIGTRWTSPDFADELIEHWRSQSVAGRAVPIKVLSLPALADGTQLDEGDQRRDEAFTAVHGAGLDNPEHRSSAWYEGKKAGLMAREPWVWYGMYQQRPQLAGSKFFQPHEWLTFDENFDLRALTYVDFSIDANLSATGPSYAVIAVTGVLVYSNPGLPNEQGEHYFMLDEGRGHWAYDELESEFLRLRRKWEIALPSQTLAGSVWVENKALGPTLLSKFQGRYPLVAVPKAKSKIYCYRVASNITAQMRVRIPVGTWGEDPTHPGLPLITDEWVGDANTKGSWVFEMMSYPSKPDDRRDAFAQQLICRDSMWDISLLGSS